LKHFLLAALAASLFIPAALAQTKTVDLPEHTITFRDDPGWHKISEIKIDANEDSSAVAVRGLHKYRAFRLFATDAPVRINRMKIFYEDGAVTDTTFNIDMKQGQTSKQFRIKNSVMVIGILYMCHPKQAGKKPHLWLYGFV
jgi:hypothetical protein